MLAHNIDGLDVGDLCVVEREWRTTPVARSPGMSTPTHKVVWLKHAWGSSVGIVALEKLPKKVVTSKRFYDLVRILIGCVVVLVIQALLAPPPIP